MTSTPAVTSPLDRRLTLAMGIQSQPGTYALLLGSGVSTGAGIKTGWGIVQHLVQRAATAAGATAEEALSAHEDPETWWRKHRTDDLLYSTLIDLVGGSTPAARRGLLDQYFTATPEDVKAGQKVPSPAHRAIAELVAGGYVRVIVTTNFDKLTERALGDLGVNPQVITRPEQVASMQPLAHAPVTIVKLHGDVSELTTRNTPIELSTYPTEWDALLDRINAEYGLVISGWSGETDDALVAAIKRNPMRRYPLYWGKRGDLTGPARQILAMQGGLEVSAADADDLFTSLAKSVTALAKMAEPPLTTALAIAALKSAIGDPTRHVEVEDLVLGAVRECVREVSGRTAIEDGGYAGLLEANLASSRRAVSLLVAGTYYDRDRRYADLWVEAVTGLLRARTPSPIFDQSADAARVLPAALALRAAGVLAVHRRRHGVVFDLSRRARAADPYDAARTTPALARLHDHHVFDRDLLKTLPGLQRKYYPESEYLRDVSFEFVRDYFTDKREYDLASDDYEFLMALMQWRSFEESSGYGASSGLFMGERQWAGGTELLAASRFKDMLMLVDGDDAWPLWNMLDGNEKAAYLVDDFQEYLRERHREQMRRR